MNGEDKTLSIVLQNSLQFAETTLDISIASVSGGNGTLPGDGSVTAKAGQSFSFAARSSTAGAVLSAIYLPFNSSGIQATFATDTGIVQWSTSSDDIGKYSVEFQADSGGVASSAVILIRIVP